MDLTTQMFLAVLSKFVSRWGFPSNVYSDNGKHFLGAARVPIRDFQEALLKFRVEVKFQYQGLRWYFIPPSAPYMGGLYEAPFKNFKYHFKQSVENSKLTCEELCTLLCRIEL